jgi:hypothetical protein
MNQIPSRLDIAARIHHLLLRDLGQGIDIDQMLRLERYARDVRLVCDAYKGEELAELAQQYRQAPPMPDEPGFGRSPQPTDWSRNTSGFGTSRPMDMLDPLRMPTPGRSSAQAPDRPSDPASVRSGPAFPAPDRRAGAAPAVPPATSLTQRLFSRWRGR